jgi:hypothetical protein
VEALHSDKRAHRGTGRPSLACRPLACSSCARAPVCHDGPMARSTRLIIGAVLVGVGAIGAAGCIAFLIHEGLDRAEKWTSLVGMVMSIGLGVVGLVIAVRDRQRGTATPNPNNIRVNGSGEAVAKGAGSSAVSGLRAGSFPSEPIDVCRSGRSDASGGGSATSGVDIG